MSSYFRHRTLRIGGNVQIAPLLLPRSISLMISPTCIPSNIVNYGLAFAQFFARHSEIKKRERKKDGNNERMIEGTKPRRKEGTKGGRNEGKREENKEGTKE